MWYDTVKFSSNHNQLDKELGKAEYLLTQHGTEHDECGQKRKVGVSLKNISIHRTLATMIQKQRADFTANPIHIIQKHYEYLFSEQDLKSFATIYMVIL